MAGAGGYAERFDWRQRTPGTKDTVGQRADTYPSRGSVWGRLEGPIGTRRQMKEADRQVVSGTIRLRGFVAVAAGDRLVSQAWGETWAVLTAVPDRAAYETVCGVERPHWTAGGGTAG